MSIRFDCPKCGKRLSAPDGATGRTATCPGCQALVTAPKPQPGTLVEEPSVASTFPPPDAAGTSADELPQFTTDEQQATTSCPRCGEPVVTPALVCQACGESLGAGTPRKKKRAAQESELETSDWLLCLLCSVVGCIMGFVCLAQGKPKGLKMVFVSLGMILVWGVVRVAMQTILQGR